MKLLANSLIWISILVILIPFVFFSKLQNDMQLAMPIPIGVLIYFIGSLILSYIYKPKNDFEVYNRKESIKTLTLGIIATLIGIGILSYLFYQIYN